MLVSFLPVSALRVADKLVSPVVHLRPASPRNYGAHGLHVEDKLSYDSFLSGWVGEGWGAAGADLTLMSEVRRAARASLFQPVWYDRLRAVDSDLILVCL